MKKIDKILFLAAMVCTWQTEAAIPKKFWGELRSKIETQLGETGTPAVDTIFNKIQKNDSRSTMDASIAREVAAARAAAEEETRRAEAERVAKEEDARRVAAEEARRAEAARRARAEEEAARVIALTPDPDRIPAANRTTARHVEDNLDENNLGPDATDPQLKTAAVNFGGTLGFGVKHFYQVIEVRKINEDGSLEVALVKTTHAFPSDKDYVKDPIATITTDSKAIIEDRLERDLQLGNRLLIKGLTRVGGAEQTQFVPDGNSNWKFIVYS